MKTYSSSYYFYVPNRLGNYTALTGEALEKLTFNSKSEFESAILSHPVRFESDISQLEKCMIDNYAGKETPHLVYGFCDIEVDYSPAIGWSNSNNPYAPINAVTIYRSNDGYTTLVVPPDPSVSLSPELLSNPRFVTCRDETELLTKLLSELETIDIITGWNSEFFDLPYIGKRIEIVFGPQALKRLEFDNSPAPRWGEAERFKGGSKETVLNLNSRVHLDYMRLFKKFNLEGRQSFALGAIANDELDIPKLHYDGSLYELYHGTWRPNLNSLKPKTEWDELYSAQVDREQVYQALEELRAIDAPQSDIVEIQAEYELLDKKVKSLSFSKFTFYNFRDVEVIVQLDQKFKYLDLANRMVHEATVNFSAIFGSVQLIDTAIINFCHLKLNKIIFDKVHRPKQQVEGALVLTPILGFHKWIGSVDINSLYPSTYRSLNLSPEKIVGQLMGYEEDWRKIYQANKNPHNDLLMNKTVILRLEGMSNDDDLKLTVSEVIDMLKDRKFAVSGYGTILDQGNGEGLIPAVLTYWFKGRKEMQAKKKEYSNQADEILNQGVKLTPEVLAELSKLL